MTRLFRVLHLALTLLWTAHAITLALALPSPQVPPLRPISTPEPPSRVLRDNTDRVRHPTRDVNTTDSTSDLDPLGSTTANATGETTNVPMGWVDPRLRDGRMLDFVLPRRGEPLNVIISGLSDPYILTRKGLLKWAQSIGYSSECLGLHLGRLHIANLGDGAGNRTEELLARINFDWPSKGWPDWGTCWETIVGGNHFRAWKQDGPLDRTGAWFLAVSAEHSLLFHHAIVPNGYDLGRDLLVSRAIQGNLPIYAPPYNFQSVPGYVWQADLSWERGLLDAGRNGVNHNITIDGRVAVLTVRRLSGGGTRNGTQMCETGKDGDGSLQVPCQNTGNHLTGGEKAKEDMRKAVVFWVRAARVCGKALRVMFGGIRGIFSTTIW